MIGITYCVVCYSTMRHAIVLAYNPLDSIKVFKSWR